MRDLFGSPLHIGFARNRTTVMRRHGTFSPGYAVVFDQAYQHPPGGADDNVFQEVADFLASLKPANKHAHVVVDDDLVRYFFVTPVSGTSRLADCLAAARMRFENLYGDAADKWQIDGQWNARHPFLACAIERSFIDKLQGLPAVTGMHIKHIIPHLVATMNTRHAQRRANAWIVVAHESSVSLALIAAGKLMAVRSHVIAESDRLLSTWLKNQLAHEAIRLGMATSVPVTAFGDVPDAWLTDGNASRATRPFQVHTSSGDTVSSTAPGVALALAGVG